jgi:hypothetical protein
MKTQSTLRPATTNPLIVAGPTNPSITRPCQQNLSITLVSVPDCVLEHDMLTFLLPVDSSRVASAHRDCAAPAHGRLARQEIRVPEDCSSVNAALAEVSFLIRHASPYSLPVITVGPGKHILKGGLVTICDSGVTIRGAGGAGCKQKSASTQIIGRIRVEGGAKDVSLEALSVSNPFGAGVWVTGKDTCVELKHCKVSGCRGDGIYARQGSHCELVSCDIEKNQSAGIAAWDDKTAFKIFDTTVAKNEGDGVKVFPGALVDVTESRVRRNSGHGVVTSDDCSSINIFSSSIIDNARGQMQGQVTVRRERSATA